MTLSNKVNGKNWKRPGSGPGSPIAGWRPIRGLLLAGLIFGLASGCATLNRAPPFLPTYPAWPTDWAMVPQQMENEGRAYIIVALPDWLTLGAYVHELERQLTASCLALGGDPIQCRAETPPPTP